MRKHKSPVKASKQDVKRHARNVSAKHAVATITKKALATIASGDKANAAKSLKDAQETIDSVCSKGILHRNTAARKISRIAKKVAALA
ncbi:MAG: 30S ribosomal protein S20 [Nitrospinae bacterium]|nr:30S ribosomal protein S20 [Nitrospinota bacterium]